MTLVNHSLSASNFDIENRIRLNQPDATHGLITGNSGKLDRLNMHCGCGWMRGTVVERRYVFDRRTVSCSTSS